MAYLYIPKEDVKELFPLFEPIYGNRIVGGKVVVYDSDDNIIDEYDFENDE